MSTKEKLQHELKAIVLVTLYFAAWLGVFMGLKVLILEDYQIHFGSVSAVLIGALILAKVVLILEYVALGYRLSEKSALSIGYRGLGTDFTDGGFTYDVVSHGLLLGYEYSF
jgi:hypothetical protein